MCVCHGMAYTTTPTTKRCTRLTSPRPAVGGSDIVDVNNANIRVYTRFPGMYPTIAAKIIKKVPYTSIDDMLQKCPFTSDELTVIDKYLKNLVALEPAPEVCPPFPSFCTLSGQVADSRFILFCSMSSTTSTTASTGKQRTSAGVCFAREYAAPGSRVRGAVYS